MDLSHGDQTACMVTLASTPGFSLAGQHPDRKRDSTKGRVAIVSLRFNPAFVSLLMAFAKACQKLGFDADFIVDAAYSHFPDLAAVAPTAVRSDPILQNSYTHSVFMNVSLGNLALASRLKGRGVKIFYLYHEPCKSPFNYFKTEGIRDGLTAFVAHHVSVRMLKLADTVILPSKYAAGVYGQGDIRHNRNASYLPLLFDDEADKSPPKTCRCRYFFSYVGGICQAHAFDQYFGFMRESLARKWNFNFMIASRHSLPAYVLKDGIIRRNLDKIEIRCGRPLQNDEINRCYSESLCVWNMYRRSTQSGVLPKAFMFGAPVLANRTGSFPEFIQDGFNGKFASAGDNQGIASALENIRENIDRYEMNCRRTFLETFFYRSNLAALSKLL
jgi:glycosyltransferase involved in cell wall biosynthesis